MTRSTEPSEIRARWIVSMTLAALSSGAMRQDVQAILGHQEQEPEELERDDHEQEDADDGAVCSRGEATGRERQQEQRERRRPRGR